MNRDDRNEEIQTGQAGNAVRSERGEVAPAYPSLLRRPGRRVLADRVGLLIGAALGAAAGMALASYWSPIHLAYHEGPAAMAGIILDGLPATILCGVIGASLLANFGWAVGILIRLLRRGRRE